MKSKILLITGADGALGKTVTARLLDEGWVLHAAVLNEKSKSILDEFFPQQINKTLFTFIADLAKETEVHNWITGIKGNIFGLVHLAGGYKGASSIADYTESDYNFLMDLNVKPTFLLLKEIAVSYTHLRAHETVLDLVCRLLLEKKTIPNTHVRSLFNMHTKLNMD